MTIKQILISTLVLSLAACGGGNSPGTAAGPSTGDSNNNSNNANNATNLVVSGGIAKFKNNTAGPDTIIQIQQSDQNTDAFPNIFAITSRKADRLAIDDNILVTNDEDATDPNKGQLKVIDLDGFKETGHFNNIDTVLALNFAADGTLYVDSVGQGLHQIDFSNLTKPVQLRRILTWFTSYESFIQNNKDADNILFQASGVNGLDIWSIEGAKDDEDVEDAKDDETADKVTLVSRLTFKDKNNTTDGPGVPFQVLALATPDQSVLSEADKKKKTLLVAARAGGVFVLDVTDPAAPFIRDRYFPENIEIWDIAVAGSYAYLAAGSQIQVLDISDLDNIKPVIGVDVQGSSKKVRVNDGYVTFALADAGVLLHRFKDDPGINYTLIPMPDGKTAQEAVYQSNAVYVAAETKILKLSR